MFQYTSQWCADLVVLPAVQAFGGVQAGGLDVDLDVFGTLSVTLEDLPKDGTSASLDDSSDHINLPVCSCMSAAVCLHLADTLGPASCQVV